MNMRLKTDLDDERFLVDHALDDQHLLGRDIRCLGAPQQSSVNTFKASTVLPYQ